MWPETIRYDRFNGYNRKRIGFNGNYSVMVSMGLYW